MEQTDSAASNRYADSGVIVQDIDSCMIKLARCCTPVPGDDIVGFITRGYGVSVHRRDCRNVRNADPKQAARWIEVSWNVDEGKPFSTTLEVECVDRDGIWIDIATVLNTARVKVTEISARELTAGRGCAIATFEVRSVTELEAIRQKLRAVEGILDVRRGQS